ncbi:hypothetical protein HELRODRAFT_172888 [Helobdella robusta]|uniref:Uncharacterized protein n=1 Tax=Helobdella robusta TaxID=6412 RepID=T1F628_HELRO|nr:hypothetical protein HELRODRAFT_172888 [Helobdella robusta]ESO03864.1 hypothetical protein HELRODRAFT_172888 [Helobdella robusta]
MRNLISAALLLLMVVSGTFAASDTTAPAAPPNDWHYTILSPRTIRPSSSYTFTVNFKAPQNSSSREAKVRASIVYWYSNKVNETKVMVSRNVSVKSGDQKLFYMQIPNSNALRNYKYSFNFSAEVQFNGSLYLTNEQRKCKKLPKRNRAMTQGNSYTGYEKIHQT